MENSKHANSQIKCNVMSCEYNDCSCEECSLEQIKVSCNCDPSDACKKETICDSFQEKESDN